VGTGPYKFHSRDENGNILLIFFKNKNADTVRFEKIKFIARSQKDLEQLAMNGNIDILYRIHGSMIERFKSNPIFKMLVRPSISCLGSV
jgi:hypothetical protein